MSEENEDGLKILSIDEIEADTKAAPKTDKTKVYRGFPIAVGDTGWSLSKKGRTYRDEDDDVPNGANVNAHAVRTRTPR